MSAFDDSLSGLLKREGFSSDVTGDPGGRTVYGIAENKHPELWKDGPPTLEQATAFYRTQWDALRCDEIASRSQLLAEKVFDIGVNCGLGHAATFFQRALNAFNRRAKDYPDVTVDGVMGNYTLSAFGMYTNRRGQLGVEVMHECLQCQQGAYYLWLGQQNPQLEDFEFGWFANRVML